MPAILHEVQNSVHVHIHVDMHDAVAQADDAMPCSQAFFFDYPQPGKSGKCFVGGNWNHLASSLE